MSKVRAGIVGLGAIGTSHAKALAALPDAEIVAVCDPLAERVEATAKTYGVLRKFTDYKEMLKEGHVDAVYVCVPNSLHHEVAIAASSAGKHVFCEKPMALNASLAQKMVAAARRAGKVFQMGMSWRHKAECRVARDLILKGEVGEVYHIRVALLRRRGVPGLGGWFTTKALSGGGGLIDIGVHFFDLVMWLTDNWKPTRVSAQTYNKFGGRMKDYVYVSMWAGPPRLDGVCDVDDYAAGLVRFGARATMSFEVSWAANVEGGNYVEILGDKGGLRLADGPNVRLFTERQGYIADVMPHFAQVNNLERQAANFIKACRGEEEPAATGEQGVVVMKLIDAIYASSQSGQEVAVGGRKK